MIINAKILRNMKRWNAIALVHGYNELAKKATVLSEKIYCRFARERAEEECRGYGVEIKHVDGEPTVLVLGHAPPYLNFTTADIEMMRETVRQHDAKGDSFVLDGVRHPQDPPKGG